MARIGILGGSFNPAHGGHRHISLQALRRLGLDQVWWLVSPQNPLKAKRTMAPLPARMLRAKEVARHPRLEVTALEVELGTRYSADTARALVRRFPQHDFIWLMGADNLVQFHRWKEWRRLARTLPIAVMARPDYIGAAHRAQAMGWLRRFLKRPEQARRWTEWRLPAILFLRIPLDARSATAIRAHSPDWAGAYIEDPAPPR
ncbi:nicotinic acid mononucleotide adenylyltransferase [Pacificimonas flava]|uniref:Probable nicotinate-nucleotide adenylyltransferase n=2 Tax=Pacificimonas TaxID=1960290 RepID=A0A219B206_9SPHN|nr:MULTISPECIES: nicotinate-nucleotide adenylyltransferase [Pacificimonas]MBZ6378131.1 nicotinate-nucleotide adenylyltransferase [Pacificimonas aurantium]OWV32234.1 nicotinic acid mononucleotide adenylyltransferase [Pacificimonas flava]